VALTDRATSAWSSSVTPSSPATEIPRARLGEPGGRPHAPIPTSISRPTTWGCAANPPPTSAAPVAHRGPMPRWSGRASGGSSSPSARPTSLRASPIARSRLNLANLLDDATARGISHLRRRPPADRRCRSSTADSSRSSRPRPTCAGGASVPFVDCFYPAGRARPVAPDLGASSDPAIPARPATACSRGSCCTAAGSPGCRSPDARAHAGRVTNSRTRSANRSGSSRCGKCPAP
jgi:hypothetical protein